MFFFSINKKDLVAYLSDELKRAREHPGAAVGVAATAAFLLMPGISFRRKVFAKSLVPACTMAVCYLSKDGTPVNHRGVKGGIMNYRGM